MLIKQILFGGGRLPYLQTKTIIPNHFNKNTASFLLEPTFCGLFTCNQAGRCTRPKACLGILKGRSPPLKRGPDDTWVTSQTVRFEILKSFDSNFTLLNIIHVKECKIRFSKNVAACPPKKALRLINNRTKVFCSIFKISFVSDRCGINLDFDISYLKMGKILKELQELEGQNAVNHETRAATRVYMCS